jgi:hypothetical protein
MNKKTKLSKNNSKTQTQTRKSIDKKKDKRLLYPKIEDFKKTYLIENVIYKNPKKPNFKYTNDDIQQYFDTLDIKTLEYLHKQINEIKKYMKLKNKINFKPVTIEWIRKNLWDASNKKWKTLYYHYENGADPNDIHSGGPVYVEKVEDRNKHDKVFCAEFQPDGNLLEFVRVKDSLKLTKIYKNWLESDKPGPYKYESINYANEKGKFYYLSGIAKFCNDSQYEFRMQICYNNDVGDNCIDGPNWIEVEPNDLLE